MNEHLQFLLAHSDPAVRLSAIMLMPNLCSSRREVLTELAKIDGRETNLSVMEAIEAVRVSVPPTFPKKG